jgi:hypothetical protein
LVEWAEQAGRFSWEAPAFIFDLDEYAVGTGADPQCHGGTRPGELERVLQQVSNHRIQDLSVSFNRDSVVNGHHGQRDAALVCFQACGLSDLFNEPGQREVLGILNALCEPDLGSDIPIVVHDLRHRESLTKKVVPVQDRTPGNLGIELVLAAAKRGHQLIQEQRHPVVDFRFGGRWNRPRGNLRPATQDDLFAVDGYELVEHADLLHEPSYAPACKRTVLNCTAPPVHY